MYIEIVCFKNQRKLRVDHKHEIVLRLTFEIRISEKFVGYTHSRYIQLVIYLQTTVSITSFP